MEGLLWYLVIGVLFYLMMRVGCGAHMVHGHHGVGDTHVDPVCGMTVEPDRGYGMMHEGRLYRFCTRNCLDKFEKDPDQYIRASHGDAGGMT